MAKREKPRRIRCPYCEGILEVPFDVCLRCGHKWMRRTAEKPRFCPKCTSIYWDKPKEGDK